MGRDSMKKMVGLKLGALVLLGSVVASAQVASHAPTKLAAAAPTSIAPAGKAVVRVNGSVLTDRDLLRQMLLLFPYARQHGGFPAQFEPEIRKQALHDIEFEELVYQEALRRRMILSPAKLEQAMKAFRQQFGSEAEFQSYIKNEVGNIQNLRAKVRRAVLIDQLLRLEIDGKAYLTPAQVAAVYRENPDRFRKPESVTLQTISIAIPEKAIASQKAAARKRAEAALSQAKATKNYEEFGVLAERISEDDWRVVMGDHKTLHRGTMAPEIEKVVFSMKPGQVSDIVETVPFFCIIRLNAREQSRMVPLSEIQAKLKKDLESEKADVLRKQLETRLRKTAKVEEL
ncbi:MAG: peptidylprolyl isomerase [Terriglobales bacterium]